MQVQPMTSSQRSTSSTRSRLQKVVHLAVSPVLQSNEVDSAGHTSVQKLKQVQEPDQPSLPIHNRPTR